MLWKRCSTRPTAARTKRFPVLHGPYTRPQKVELCTFCPFCTAVSAVLVVSGRRSTVGAMWWLKRAIAVVVAALLCLTLPAPPANAAGRLVVGMPILIGGKGSCSLGFFGLNARGDRMAVTAGHCSRAVGEVVHASGGIPIGLVVSRLRDAQDSEGRLTGSRGYTLIGLYRRFGLQPYFAGTGKVTEGDFITKYGDRSGKTSGVVTAVRSVADRPDLGLIASDIVHLPGDSGSPWVRRGLTLIGMGSSGNMEKSGGTAGSQGQPISSVINMIRDGAGVWGSRFNVWIE